MDRAPGPEHDAGSTARFLDRAIDAARRCGVTRLADITGLDRLGLPVWQAVRPAGRSLSVHQGKGPSAEAARIGALCEAIEAHRAENVPADGPLVRFVDLPPDERAPEIGDYCRSRTELPKSAEPIQWCAATDVLTGKACFLPFPLISIDYTRGLPSRFERTSGGLGAGASEQDAMRTALLEIVERDGVGQWQRRDGAARMSTAIDLDTIPIPWFQSWRDRFAALGVDLWVFQIPSIVGLPISMCVIGGTEEFGSAHRRFHGTSAHGDPEIALFKALAEAIQSRLTFIAGVRDDILPSRYLKEGAGPPDLPAGRQAWSRIEPQPCAPESIAGRLAGRGYRQVAAKRLDDGRDGVFVAKAFVPGLGSLTRMRRAPQ